MPSNDSYNPFDDPDLAHIPREWLREFKAVRKRPLETHFKYSFSKTYKPVMDDATYRSFDTTADYCK